MSVNPSGGNRDFFITSSQQSVNEQQGPQDSNFEGLLADVIDITNFVASSIIEVSDKAESAAKIIAESATKAASTAKRAESATKTVAEIAESVSGLVGSGSVKKALKLTENAATAATETASAVGSTGEALKDVAVSVIKIAEQVSEGAATAVKMVETAVKTCRVAWGLLNYFG